MRRGVWVLALVALAASAGASFARADGTTTAGTTTGTTSATTYSALPSSLLPSGCVGAGVAAIEEPNRRVLALGTPAAALGPSAYPVAAPVVAVGAATTTGSGCGQTRVTLSSLSLFGGAVTATSVTAAGGRGTVSGLEIGGAPVAASADTTMLVADWGQLTVGAQIGRTTAPLVLRLLAAHGSLPAGTSIVIAFAADALPPAHPPQRHHAAAGPGDQGSGGHAAAAPTHPKQKAKKGKKRHRHRKHVRQPLKQTPALGLKQYVFPVDGGASYADTYGANRSDIYDGWHHGDDLFAPLGTPVVAVARGRLSLVGWNRLGGWRLWLTDKLGNTFYYAHLAAYSRWILDHRNVKPGQVIGFLGRTGDAFTTTPHLHFEVHPQQFLRLGYDGAVDPSTYLQSWKIVHVPGKELPRPARLKAPVGTPAQEASVVWHELLVARHLLPAAAAAPVDAPRRPFPTPSSSHASADAAGLQRQVAAVRLAARLAGRRSDETWRILALALGILTVSAVATFAVRRRRRAVRGAVG